MLDGVKAAIYTVTVATPYLGGAIGLLVATTNPENVGLIPLAIGGGVFGATAAAVWEATVNQSDPWDIKTGVVLGSGAIGAGAGVVSGLLR